MLNKERLINDLKKLHSEIFIVYRNIFDYKFNNDDVFQKRIHEEYKKDNKVTDSEKVEWNEQYFHRSAYTLLNKILFIRICEDKGFMLNDQDRVMGTEVVPNAGQKLSMIGFQKWTNLITNYSLSELIKFAFKDMNRSYRNISLYKEDKYDWLIPNKNEIESLFFSDKETFKTSPYNKLENLLKNIIETLDTYRYNFEESSENVLGDVYEKFMDRETRKKLGQFYTPDFVIKYILEHTLMNTDVLSNPFVKVLDPSCGSGHFLIMAYDILRSKFEESLTDLQNTYAHTDYKVFSGDESYIIKGNEYWTKKYLHYHILKNCIYGADIDGFALQITVINLLLKDLDNFITDDLNIIECDSLQRWEKDYDWENLDEQLKSNNLLLEVKHHNVNGFNEIISPSFEEAYNIVKIGRFWSTKFDYVIGNPPYVRQENIDNKHYLKVNYTVYNSISDLLTYFIERGLSLLKDEGQLGFIISDKFTRANYGKYLRKFISESYSLERYKDDFEQVKPVFDEAVVDACIIIINNKKPTKNETFILNDKNQYLQEDLSDQGWYLSESMHTKVKNKMDKVGRKIKDINELTINRGLLTGLNEAFIIDTETRNYLCEKDPKNKEIIKPILRGRDVKQYHLEWSDNWLIFIPWHFPLQDNPSIQGASLEAEKTFKDSYPVLYNYLLKYKDKLSNRNKAETGIRYEWYVLQRFASEYYRDFEKEKIVYPNMSIENRFYFDIKGYYSNDKSFIITSNKINLKYLSGLLNSSTLFFYFRTVTPTLQGDTREYRKVFVEQVPIVIKQSYINEISNLVSELLMPLPKYNEQQPTISNFITFDIEYTEAQIKNNRKKFKIDQLVYEVYGLEVDEIEVVEKEMGSLTFEREFYVDLLKKGAPIKIDIFEEYGDVFLNEIAKKISPELFYKEHVINSKTIEDISTEYGFEYITVANLRKKYINEASNDKNKLYNLSKLYNHLTEILNTEILNILKEKGTYFSNVNLVDILDKRLSEFDNIIGILKKDNIAKKKQQVIKDEINKWADTWKTYTTNKNKGKKVKPIVKYDTTIYGLASWSDELHKDYFIDSIRYHISQNNQEEYQQNVFGGIKKNEKKARVSLESLKELQFADKEDYIELLSERIDKVY
jgi:hypothetical protein